jgi:3-deoxy-D-manno-octulosonic-acid transferase
VLAQNDSLAERFAQLGAAQARDTGNLKADAPPPPVDETGKAELASALSERPMWLASSTHPGEDEVIGTAHSLMKKALPNLLTIIVPRHPERGAPIAEMLRGEGLSATLRSGGGMPDSGTDIYIADTIGELGLFYALTPVAFIGGSLVKHGGQNPIEAIKLGAAVLTGPNFQNFRDSYGELLKSGGAKEVTDAETLAVAVLGLLQDDTARTAMMTRAETMVASMSGALPRTLQAIEPYLPPRASLQHAS